jgi:hypothetical protein
MPWVSIRLPILIAILIWCGTDGRSPNDLLTVPSTLTEIGTRERRGSALGPTPLLNLTKRSRCSVSSAWANETVAKAATVLSIPICFRLAIFPR